MIARAWFLLFPLLWFGVVFSTISLLAGLTVGLLSFVSAASAYLVADRYRVPGAASLAACCALIGPFVFGAIYSLLFAC